MKHSTQRPPQHANIHMEYTEVVRGERDRASGAHEWEEITGADRELERYRMFAVMQPDEVIIRRCGEIAVLVPPTAANWVVCCVEDRELQMLVLRCYGVLVAGLYVRALPARLC